MFYLLLLPLLISAQPNYYWREYTGGEIPEDAVVGGKDRIGNKVYIGQVYVRPNSLLIVQINSGVKEVVVWTATREVMYKNIKILCGPPQNFLWFESNGTDPEGKEAVLGGHLQNNSVSIGRIEHDGNTIIASVYDGGFHWGDIDDLDRHIHIRTFDKYEILVYKEIATCLTWEARDGYYWREYDGTIPQDAFPGGTDINRRNIFIGQATFNDDVAVVKIVPGLTEVENPMTGERIDNSTKILCGNPTNFEWISTTTNTIQVSLIDKYAIIGGHLNDFGRVWIGRISSCNEIKIGMIPCCNVNQNLVLPKKDVNVASCSAYQVLVTK